MNIVIIITVLLVSVDALFIGMYLKLQNNFKHHYLLLLAFIKLICCMIAYLLASVIMKYINFDINFLVGIIFLILALETFFAGENKQKTINISSIILFGIIISLDGVLVTMVLTIDFGQIILIPLFVTISHLLFLITGSLAASYIETSYKLQNTISASCLLTIAILNFIGIL